MWTGIEATRSGHTPLSGNKDLQQKGQAAVEVQVLLIAAQQEVHRQTRQQHPDEGLKELDPVEVGDGHRAGGWDEAAAAVLHPFELMDQVLPDAEPRNDGARDERDAGVERAGAAEQEKRGDRGRQPNEGARVRQDGGLDGPRDVPEGGAGAERAAALGRGPVHERVQPEDAHNKRELDRLLTLATTDTRK